MYTYIFGGADALPSVDPIGPLFDPLSGELSSLIQILCAKSNTDLCTKACAGGDFCRVALYYKNHEEEYSHIHCLEHWLLFRFCLCCIYFFYICSVRFCFLFRFNHYNISFGLTPFCRFHTVVHFIMFASHTQALRSTRRFLYVPSSLAVFSCDVLLAHILLLSRLRVLHRELQLRVPVL